MAIPNDPVERAIGRFGKYQTWIYILITIGRLPTEYQLANVVFVIPSVRYVCLDEGASSNLTNTCPCQNPQYDTSTVVSSVTSTWNLICERGNLASLAQSIMQVGILAGSLIFGYISDRYGRKLAVMLSLLIEVATVVMSSLATDFWMFLVCRLLIGAAVGGTMLCCYVYIVELSGVSFRPYLTGLNDFSYVLGYFTLPMIAYYVRDWRSLQLYTSVPWVLVIALFWILPESPLWLVTAGKKQQAIDVLTHISKKNNKPTDHIEEIVNQMEQDSLIIQNQQRGSFIDLIRTPKIRVYTFIMSLVWCCIALVFFGVNQYIGELQGDLYLNVMLSAVATMPGLVLCVIGALYFKRRICVITSFTTAAISLLVFIFIPSDLHSVNLLFAAIGHVAAHAAFIQVYLYSSELFPTVIRNSAMGLASTFARLGGFIAPFVVNIGVEWASILIFSGTAFFAAVLCSFLPETKGVVLLNTIEQTENNNNSQTNKARN